MISVTGRYGHRPSTSPKVRQPTRSSRLHLELGGKAPGRRVVRRRRPRVAFIRNLQDVRLLEQWPGLHRQTLRVPRPARKIYDRFVAEISGRAFKTIRWGRPGPMATNIEMGSPPSPARKARQRLPTHGRGRSRGAENRDRWANRPQDRAGATDEADGHPAGPDQKSEIVQDRGLRSRVR